MLKTNVEEVKTIHVKLPNRSYCEDQKEIIINKGRHCNRDIWRTYAVKQTQYLASTGFRHFNLCLKCQHLVLL